MNTIIEKAQVKPQFKRMALFPTQFTIAVCIKTDEPIKLLSFIKSEIPDVETWSDYR